MATPKSRTMLEGQQRAADLRASAPKDTSPDARVYEDDESIPVKPVNCYNDFVAVLQFRVKSQIILNEGASLKNEGMVIGVGPGLPGPDGKRVPSQLKLGDVVVFYGNPTTTINPSSGVYKDQRVVIFPERAVICGLKPRPFHLVEEGAE